MATGDAARQFEEDARRAKEKNDPITFIRDLEGAGKKRQKGERKEQATDIFAQGRSRLLGRQASDAQTLRKGFTRSLKLGLGQQQQGLAQRFRQSAGRAGLANSGVEQAGLQTVAAAGQQQFAQSLGEFESKLAALQAQERAAFDQGEMNFVASMLKMSVQFDMEKELARMQAEMAADAQTAEAFGVILGTGSQVVLNYLNPL